MEFPSHKLRKLDPEGLIDKSTPAKNLQLDSFFLSLAVVFNDIKGIAILEEDFLEKYEKPGGELSSHSGQWAGIRLQITKYSASILFESIRLIETNKSLILSPEFNKYYSHLNSQDRNIWLLFLNVCGIEHSESYDHDKIDSFKKILELIRHNISFHYWDSGKPLVQGFRNHFFQYAGKGTEGAYYSLQKTDFWNTRFYYADAALQGFFNEVFRKHSDVNKPSEEISRLIISLAKVIAGLLETYIDEKPKK